MPTQKISSEKREFVVEKKRKEKEKKVKEKRGLKKDKETTKTESNKRRRERGGERERAQEFKGGIKKHVLIILSICELQIIILYCLSKYVHYYHDHRQS